MVSDRFLRIYGNAENHRPTGKCVKCTPASWGLKKLMSSSDSEDTSVKQNAHEVHSSGTFLVVSIENKI